jgi:26S proteasome regulatory subunit N10
MSMEEEAARQAAVNAPAPSSPGATAAPTAAASDGGVAVAVQQPSGPAATAAAATGTTDEGEEAILQQALALSEGGHGGAPDVEMTEEQDGDENLTEEEMIARAIEMSMRPEPESEGKKK